MLNFFFRFAACIAHTRAALTIYRSQSIPSQLYHHRCILEYLAKLFGIYSVYQIISNDHLPCSACEKDYYQQADKYDRGIIKLLFSKFTGNALGWYWLLNLGVVCCHFILNCTLLSTNFRRAEKNVRCFIDWKNSLSGKYFIPFLHKLTASHE